MSLLQTKAETSPLGTGQSVLILHERSQVPIRIQGTVARAEHPHYWVDTENHRNIKIHRKHLIEQ